MPANEYQWNYEDLCKLTGMTMMALYKHKSRGEFNPENLGSVFFFIARHGTLEVKQQAILEMIARDKSQSGEARKTRRKIKGVKDLPRKDHKE